jgi:molybdopterin converting factor small subunit
MRIQVKLFAAAREAADGESIEIELPIGATVAGLRVALMERLPKSRDLLARSMFALNCEYARDESKIPANADVACIPPVSGG